MKKSLLALAVLGAFAGAANAQTNVTVYGVIDAGISRETGGANGSVWNLASGVQSGNRLGFKGTEDLGGGLKANFQLENGFNVDTGTQRQGALFGRQAFVGLSGNFGAVNLGRQYDPLFIALDSIDPFGTGLTGASTNLMAAGSKIWDAAGVVGNGEVPRVNNAITYSSPNVSGFTANALYGLGETAGNNSANRTYALSGTYANGPVAAVLAYSSTNAPATIAADKFKVLLVGGTYDLGVAKAHLAYETEKSDSGADFRDWLLGVSAPVAGGTVMASFIKQTDKAAGGNAGAKQYALGYTYPLSKRTNVYTSYGHITNDAGANNVVSDASSGGANSAPNFGQSSSGFAVGVRHTF
ncbi:porin [Noviherbaspirillum autotrophicum]|uniref:Porin n=1 Tax=Noviherbaspirillum autotrophicum TaxID=709839 RepID=A0A0C2BIV0_9BURK|nr:porin [Noviherbaspirillum autotrophicum]KIF81165.1 porin [Noviherbaspirillum autotrophicum]